MCKERYIKALEQLGIDAKVAEEQFREYPFGQVLSKTDVNAFFN